MSGYVLDTSVVIKWLCAYDEGDLSAALRLRDEIVAGKHEVIVPDLICYELANALRYNPNFVCDDVKVAMNAIEEMELPMRTVNRQLIAKAVDIAFGCNVTVYDSCFLALAEIERKQLVTADYKFFKRIAQISSIIRLDRLYETG